MILHHQRFLAIRKILNQYDPVGIIYGDINSDEYDIEVRAILELITDQENHESLAQKLHQVLIRYFDENIAGDYSIYKRIAIDILKLNN